MAIHYWLGIHVCSDVGKLLLGQISTKNTCLWVCHSLIYLSLFLSIVKEEQLSNFFMEYTGSWFFVSVICGILVNFVTNFYLIVACFVAFICSAICSSIVMAVAVNLYPTNYRSMATSFIMLFGRLGSSSGSSIIGLLLQDYCTTIFYVFGGTLISK